jgi:hypothetical protein
MPLRIWGKKEKKLQIAYNSIKKIIKPKSQVFTCGNSRHENSEDLHFEACPKASTHFL